ncbi:uncharacterized protein LACBIDRAFT_329459 [Laccaria bicolor S238N-H82]|uniref:Predicted protein n=1 Tax=Laccaria bicolor (strain S238N-H82 / ATCC MYA-4686) TaxID=486041 RepID=B0DI35_LACBS|nr:uncharacterized protein LACBIDRAFT_329459 [Laccaria bicolor S238N-H82]EDR05935.1 predicted protein [Laccaria bicolor S238N-H82]|eukprot:XP_001883611.1 predicted protein [Laccaria bicolor S238N-H82]
MAATPLSMFRWTTKAMIKPSEVNWSGGKGLSGGLCLEVIKFMDVLGLYSVAFHSSFPLRESQVCLDLRNSLKLACGIIAMANITIGLKTIRVIVLQGGGVPHRRLAQSSYSDDLGYFAPNQPPRTANSQDRQRPQPRSGLRSLRIFENSRPTKDQFNQSQPVFAVRKVTKHS